MGRLTGDTNNGRHRSLRRLVTMSTTPALPTLDQVNAALAEVNDPEIKRPITELGMVDSVAVEDGGVVKVRVLLTVAGVEGTAPPVEVVRDRWIDNLNQLGAPQD